MSDTEIWLLIFVGVALFALAAIVAFHFWSIWPQRCEVCLRRLGYPTEEELRSGKPIGCPMCNLNLKP